jgi:hypothetical protein
MSRRLTYARHDAHHPQDVRGVHVSDDLKDPARPDLVHVLKHECPGETFA